MTVAFTAAVFAWFGAAIGAYTADRRGRRPVAAAARRAVVPAADHRLRAGAAPRRPSGMAVRCARWPAQPPGSRRSGSCRSCSATRSAIGLHPSPAAAPGRRCRRRGGPHAPAAAGERRRRARRWRAVATAACARMAQPLALAAMVPLLLAGYGFAALSRAVGPRPRTSRCAWAWCSRTSSTTSACAASRAPTPSSARCWTSTSRCRHDAVERQRVDAVLWSETVYPTTFGHPKSDDGAELDREILGSSTPPACRSCSAPTTATPAANTTRPPSSSPARACSASTARRALFPLTEYVPGVARRADAAALAALGRHLAAGQRRARVSAAAGRRPRDPGAADDLPGRCRCRPGHRRCAAGRAGDPDDVERLLVHRASRRARGCTRRRRRSAASRRACRSSASPPTASAP